jgi:MOB kinase activator 1
MDRCQKYAFTHCSDVKFLVVDLFSELSVLCNAISDFCTEKSCPIMRAGRYYEYAWADPSCPEYASPVMVSAPKYMELLMIWVEKHLISSGKDNHHRPAGSISINNRIFSRRLFRVYAHIFSEHWEYVSPILHHLQYSLLHFMVFTNEYRLIVNETEADPIRSIIDSLSIPNLSFT